MLVGESPSGDEDVEDRLAPLCQGLSRQDQSADTTYTRVRAQHCHYRGRDDDHNHDFGHYHDYDPS